VVRLSFSIWLSRIAIAMTTLLGAACDDAPEGEDSSGESDASTTDVPEVDYATQIQPIWNARCTCHLQGMSGTMEATTLTLNPEFSHDELVGTPAVAVPTMARIEPGDPDASYLWHKIHDTQLGVGGGGTEMPPGETLAPADVELIEHWIRGGALP
jgi:hypothetical protein